MFLKHAGMVLAILCVLAVGCSSGHNNGVTPGMDPSTPDMGLTGQRSVSGTQNNVLWGMWDVRVNAATGEVEITPLRSVQWTLDVVQFLHGSGPAKLLIHVVDISEYMTTGYLPVDVSLVHPFPGLSQYCGFDVRGIFYTQGSVTADHNGDLVWSDGGTEDAYLANADGYTRWMNPTEFPNDGSIFTYTPGAFGNQVDFSATLNPYKYFCDGLQVEDDVYDFFTQPDNLEDRGIFTTSVTNTRRYDLWIPLTGTGGAPNLEFQYAVLASWDNPTDLDPGDLPGSFPNSANQMEPYLVEVVDNSTLYWTIDEAGGDISLDIEIFDWAPYLGASDTLLDEIESITIESTNGITVDPYYTFDSTYVAANAIPGNSAASSIVPIEITGCTPDGLNGQEILIGIEQTGYDYSNYGFGTVYPDAPLSAYAFHNLTVDDEAPVTDGPIITSITPNIGIPDTHIYDVEVVGENFLNVTELKLVGDTEETTAINLTIIDENNMMCELDFTGLSIGLYDVVAVDPGTDDGVLEDGYELLDCPGGIQSGLTLYNTSQRFDPLFVAGILTSGNDAGDIITQWGHAAWTRIDVQTPPADGMTAAYWAAKPSLSSIINDWAWSMDMDPVNEVFAYTGYDDDDDSGSWPNTQHDFVKICNQSDGSYVGGIDTDCGYAVTQVDIDERGNVWVVCSHAYYPNHDFTVQRWDYDPAAPAPHYTFVGEYDISALIESDEVISDIVVLQRYRRMYISHSPNSDSYPTAWGVEIDCWDISGTTPVWLNNAYDSEEGFYGTNSFPEVHQRFVDFEVDRTDDVLAGCRLLAMYMARPNSSGDRTLELRKYDVDLNLINESSDEFFWTWTSGSYTYEGWFSNYVLDDQNGGRVVAIWDDFNNPATQGIVGVSEAPSDW